MDRDPSADWVRAYVETGRRAWPCLTLDADVAARHVAERAEAEPLPVEHAADLYLACACAHGVPGAVEAFERTFASDIAAALARVVPAGAARDDAMQALRVKVLVAEEGLPRIAAYAGRAPLKRWLASTAVRLALNVRRNMADGPHDALSSAVGQESTGRRAPELTYLRARYTADFEAAVRVALRALSPRDATLLRLHLEQRLGIDALGTMYKVGRSTAARWLQAARGALADGVRRELYEKLALAPSELESVAAALLSQLDVSVVDILNEGKDEGE